VAAWSNYKLLYICSIKYVLWQWC